MAESIIAYIPSNDSSSVSVYQYKKEEYNFTWDLEENRSSYAIHNFELPSTALTYRVKIPYCRVYGENSESPEIVTWPDCTCGLYDLADPNSRRAITNFTSGRICDLSPYEYQPSSSTDIGLYVRIGLTQKQDTNTGSAYFHCWTNSPVQITCEYIYLDPKFPD